MEGIQTSEIGINRSKVGWIPNPAESIRTTQPFDYKWDKLLHDIFQEYDTILYEVQGSRSTIGTYSQSEKGGVDGCMQ